MILEAKRKAFGEKAASESSKENTKKKSPLELHNEKNINISICLWSETLWLEILAKSIGSPLPFCFLSNRRIFVTILITIFGFSFSGCFFVLIYIFNSINETLI